MTTAQKLLPLISPTPDANPAPPYHITAAQHEIAMLLGLGNLQTGLLALLDAGMRRTPPADTLRRNLLIYREYKLHLVPKAVLCATHNLPMSYVGKVIRDCEVLESEWGL